MASSWDWLYRFGGANGKSDPVCADGGARSRRALATVEADGVVFD